MGDGCDESLVIGELNAMQSYWTRSMRACTLAGYMNVLALQALLACNMALLEVGKIAFSGTPGIIDNMRTHHLLAVQQNCSRCAVAMRERPRADVSDGASWWCPRCKTRKSIRSGPYNASEMASPFSLLGPLLLYSSFYTAFYSSNMYFSQRVSPCHST